MIIRTLLDACWYVLETQGEAQSCYWLATIMLEMKLWRASESRFRKTLDSDIVNHGELSKFVKVGDDEYALRCWTARRIGSSETLLAYHGYLAANLTFPFRARYDKRIGRFEWGKMPLDVTGLLRPDECEIAEEYGIIATGQDAEESVDFPLDEVEVKESSPSCRLVRDYARWFHNGRGTDTTRPH